MSKSVELSIKLGFDVQSSDVNYTVRKIDSRITHAIRQVLAEFYASGSINLPNEVVIVRNEKNA